MEMLLPIILIIVIVTFVLLYLVGKAQMRKEQKSKGAEKALQEAAKDEKEEAEKCKPLYEKCHQNGVKGDETKEDQKRIALVAKTMGITDDPEEALTIYRRYEAYVAKEKAKKDAEKKERCEKKYTLAKQRQDAFSELIAQPVDKMYYGDHCMRVAYGYQRIAQHCGANAEQFVGAIGLSARVNRPRNAAIAGGAMSAVGGLFAGLATAVSVEADNAARARQNSSYQAEFAQAARMSKRMQGEALGNYRRCQEWLQKLEGCLFSEDTPMEELYNTWLVPSSKSITYKQTEYGTLIISTVVRTNRGIPKILDSRALIDGVLRAEVYEEFGQKRLVGVGYVFPKGYYDMPEGREVLEHTHFDHVGFYDSNGTPVTGEIFPVCEDHVLSRNGEYKVKFRPEKLWMIERKDLGTYATRDLLLWIEHEARDNMWKDVHVKY